LVGNEYPEHINAKKRLAKILRKKGFITFYEVDTGPTETEIGTRSYTLDILGIWQYSHGSVQEIAFEVDGIKGHHSKRNRDRDKFRDRVHWEYQRIPTVRLNRFWLAGRNKVTDDDIWIETIWQLKTKFGVVLR
jgi:hypothetical protein